MAATVGRVETCPTCPFAWDAVTRSDVSPRILTVTHQFSQLIRDHADTASRRPSADDLQQLADEIATAAALFTRTIDVLPLGYELRPIFYNWPVAATRTLGWVGAQALHECEHHYSDAQAQT